MPPSPTLVWFRDDLRLEDNPALAAAADGPMAAVYLLDDETPGAWRLGGAARWWLHNSLAGLSASLSALGVRLILRRGRAETAIPALVREGGYARVVWNRRWRAAEQAADAAIKARLRAEGVAADSFNASLLVEPHHVSTGAGGPYKVFTPFWRAVNQRLIDAPTAAPTRLIDAGRQLESADLRDWRLLPAAPDWAGGLREAWNPGEKGARRRLAAFLDGPLRGYAQRRNRPGEQGTSRLSPHLRFGEISPRLVFHAAAQAAEADRTLAKDAAKFQAELGWREFSAHLLHHFPTFPEESWRAEFADFPWREDPAALSAWRAGRTGYPIVDAGMRELWATGWMHNRVRMIVGSFLVKHLLIHWRAGEDWFWDTLVDADLANNAAGWQWIAGCGADAAPYFRIFNPVSQGETWDPDGAYVRRWVPELARLPEAMVHKPWAAPRDMLRAAGVSLGSDYPSPIIDHAVGRARALAAFAGLKRAA